MKKRIFIGSSSEELGTAKIVKSILEQDFDVVIWDESIWDKSIFKINNNFLSDLLTATLKFDFGILIGTPDDKLEYRGEEKLTARDNVLFELGLFTGRLGLEKCAFLIEESVKVPSDLGGITLAMYNNSTLADRINGIKQMFLNASNTELNFFPSNTLAYAYYENFVKHVCEHYVKNNGFTYKNNNYPDCKLRIIIPYKLPNDLNLAFNKIQNDIGVDKLSFSAFGRPRNVYVDAKVVGGKLILLDFPTTLTGIDYAISNHLPKDYKHQTDDYNLIIERELNKFIDTLNKILTKNDFDEFVEIVRS
ncbi:CBASS system CD-NTase-associated NAD(+) hydrolase Cap12 [Winogradskyella arenosi]|uniref:CD-NTase-associated protein 12 n=1 Tax=Winogradskyella arenosi TaxID=533325 RepID=A0A368ZIL5_9FLAO|nr:STING domain-containing protein [Winogradskyella arenosi]RCW93632.1 putative nucleotide-binding protein with TIR-like domain [Winogradskyella arenosi]